MVEWESSNLEIVGHDGVINKSLEEKTTATLTGTLTNGDIQQVLDIEVTVIEPRIHYYFCY